MRAPRFAEAIQAVVETLAAECGCLPEHLTDRSVRLVERPLSARQHPLARRYPWREPAFAAVSLGRGAVLSASPSIIAAVEPVFRGADRDQVFAPRRLARVDELLAPDGLSLAGPYPRLVCGSDTARERRPPPGFEITVLANPSQERLTLLGPAAWPNAISAHPTRTTTALAVTMRGDLVAGVAACSADTERLWQIGIDVAEEHRGRGIGAALTSALARHILDQGAVPWYSAAPANVASINTAVAAGFRLGWVDVGTMSDE